MFDKYFLNKKIRLITKLTIDNHKYIAFIICFTGDNILLSSDYSFDQGKITSLECDLESGRHIVLKGHIISNEKIHKNNQTKYETKIRLNKLTRMDVQLMNQYLGEKFNRRVEKRKQIKLKTQMIHPIVISDLTITNASENGFFLVTEVPIPVSTFIRVQTSINQKEMIIDGVVVNLLDRVSSQLIEKDAGIDVNIVNMNASNKELWKSILTEQKKKPRRPAISR